MSLFRLGSLLFEEVFETLRRPSRLGRMFSWRRVRGHLEEMAFKIRVGQQWNATDAEQRCKTRVYPNYETYKAHQRSKMDFIERYVDLTQYDSAFRKQLSERLTALAEVRMGMNVLCLGARTGTEVRAFLDRGCYAVGIDVNPGKENRYVLHGDFHDLQFASQSVDLVFTNTLDHAYTIERVLQEVSRVVKSDGFFLVEATRRAPGKNPSGFYESFWWATAEDLIALIEQQSFRLVRRAEVEFPWHGDQLLFRKQAGDGGAIR